MSLILPKSPIISENERKVRIHRQHRQHTQSSGCKFQLPMDLSRGANRLATSQAAPAIVSTTFGSVSNGSCCLPRKYV
ncbi:MAG TPA: hypothetical protein VGX78_08895, partial [Pirellulales bacterium]|nr:hypothetical protein [Pirellulales bacterium]